MNTVKLRHKHCQIIVTTLVAISVAVYYLLPESEGLFAVFDITAVMAWIWLE